MNGTGTQLRQKPAVLEGRITFMLGEAIAGIGSIRLDHHPIPSYLGHDGCRGDGVADAVAADQAQEGNPRLRQGHIIDQQMRGL